MYIYLISAIFSLLGLVYIVYIYLTSDQPDILVRFFFMPLILVIGLLLIAILGAILFRKYQFSRTKRTRLWFLEENKRKREIETKEDLLIKSLETKVIIRINTMSKNKEFIDELKPVMANLEKLLRAVYKIRKKRLGPFEPDTQILKTIRLLCRDPILSELANNHPKFKAMLSRLKILNTDKEVTINEVQNFLISVLEIIEDAHLESVISSSKAVIEVYNQVVEVYESYRDELYHKIGTDVVLLDAEAKFMRKIDEVTGKPVMGRIRGNPKYISLYNSMVDIYNHYKEKSDMFIDEKNKERMKR